MVRKFFVLLSMAMAFFCHIADAQDDGDEDRAIKKLGLLGALVERDEQLPEKPVVLVWFNENCRFNDKYIHLLKPLK